MLRPGSTIFYGVKMFEVFGTWKGKVAEIPPPEGEEAVIKDSTHGTSHDPWASNRERERENNKYFTSSDSHHDIPIICIHLS